MPMSKWLKYYSPAEIKRACLTYVDHLSTVAVNALIAPISLAYDGAKWITVHPNGKGYNNNGDKIKGRPVLIDEESGEVLGGAGGKFNGKHISEMPQRGANALKSQHDIARVQQKRSDPEGFAKRQQELIAKRDQQLKQAQEAAAKVKAEAERKAKEAQEQQAKEQAAAQQRAKEQTAAQHTEPKADPLQMDTAELLKSCALPFKGEITKGLNLRGINLNKAFDWEALAKELTTEEYDVLDLGRIAIHNGGPNVVARYTLKSSPLMVVSNTKLQTAFNKLTANMCAGQMLKAMHKAGVLKVPQDKLDLADKLKAQYDQVKTQYLEKSVAHSVMVADSAFNELKSALSDQSERDLIQSGLDYCVQDLNELYKKDNSRGYPIFGRALCNQEFECENPHAAAWLKLATTEALFKEWAHYLPEDFAAARLKPLKKSLNAQMKQAEQALKLLDGCDATQALTREYSKYRMRVDPLQSQHEAKPAAIGLGQDQAAAGRPMDAQQANEMRGNPYFTKVDIIATDRKGKEYRPYQINCQSCVVAYEMRRRGYDVEALPNFQAVNENDELQGPEMLSYNCPSMWYNPETGAWPDRITFPFNKDLNQDGVLRALQNHLDVLIKPGQRYHIEWGWDWTRGAHIITVEKDDKGNLTAYDPQRGSPKQPVALFLASYRAPIRADSINVYRVDNCELMTPFANDVLVKAGHDAITARPKR